MADELARMQAAGAFREQTPYGPDVHARKLADYFDRHYGEQYLKLSGIGMKAWLDDFMVDLTRVGTPVTAEEWGQYLKDLGAGLLRAWLLIMAQETPEFLRPLVNLAELQRRHEAHLAGSIATKIDFLMPLVPSPVAASVPDRAPESGLASVVAAKPTPVPSSEQGAEVTPEIAPTEAEPDLLIANDREPEAKHEPKAQTAVSSPDSQPSVNAGLSGSEAIPGDADADAVRMPPLEASVSESVRQQEQSAPSGSAIETLAKYVRDRLDERGWSEYDLETAKGPNHKTTQAIFRGDKVQHKTRLKLVKGFSNFWKDGKQLKITLKEIPRK